MIKEISEDYFLFSFQLEFSVDPPPPLISHNPMYGCSINCGVKYKSYHHENTLYKMVEGVMKGRKSVEKYKYTRVKYTHDRSRRRISEDAAPHFFVWLIYL